MSQALVEKRSVVGGPALTISIVGAVGLSVVGFLWSQGPSDDILRTLLRATARISFSLFVVTFSASSLDALLDRPFTDWLRSNRRYLGLSFGGVHLIHGALVWTLASRSHGGDLTALARAWQVAAGMVVYGLIVVMMATSNDAAVRQLGPARWRRLHRIGIWALFLVFLGNYVNKALGSGPQFWTPVVVLGIALTLRRWTWGRGSKWPRGRGGARRNRQESRST